jgi:hypothetical protein
MRLSILALVVAAVIGTAVHAQPPSAEQPKIVKEVDTKALADLFTIVRTDYDPVRKQVTWLLESKTALPFPRLVARCFDQDDVEYDAPFIDFQHGARSSGERTRGVLLLPLDREVLTKTKRIVIAPPANAR